MDLTNQLILIGSAVVLLSVLAGAWSTRAGVPVLLVFLIGGMLLGEDGPGGIQFDDVRLAHLIGSVALAIILFDGGIRTRTRDFRVGLRPALGLATVGVVVTAGITGIFATWLLDLHWMQGLLVGAIVGSTDAAAVFSLLRANGFELKKRVAATLEIESGSNDPMAIFLTIVLIEALVAGHTHLDWMVLREFVIQMSVGAAIGLFGGLAVLLIVNRMQTSPGLYALAVLAGGLTVFGIAAVAQGSGFLAIYLAGIVLGNRPLQASHNVRRFHDGIAWLSQIGMFLMLGLLVTPSELVPVAIQASLLAAVLIVLARPLAVWLCLLPFHFPWREQLFISWVGLRGAVPIILGVFPLLAGIDRAIDFFNVAFFVVLISLAIQGWTIAPVARLLRLDLPRESHIVQRLDIDIPGQQDFEVVGYQVAKDSPLMGTGSLSQVLPPGVRVAAVFRDRRMLSDDDSPPLQEDDYIFLVADRTRLDAVDRLFVRTDPAGRRQERQFFGEFILNGNARLGEIGTAYGTTIDAPLRDRTVDEHIREHLHTQPVVGDRITVGNLEFVVREVSDDRITKVGLKLLGSG